MIDDAVAVEIPVDLIAPNLPGSLIEDYINRAGNGLGVDLGMARPGSASSDEPQPF